MGLIATRNSWKNQPLPASHKSLEFDRILSQAEFDQVRKGFIPTQMEDRWFVFWEDPWLSFHRSWTGYCIYQARIVAAAESWFVSEVLVNRNKDQYTAKDDSRDKALLVRLLTWLVRERQTDCESINLSWIRE